MYLYMCPRLKRVSNCRLQTSVDGDAYPEHRSRNMVVHCWQTCRLPGLSRSACIQHHLLRIWILPYTPINPAMMSGWFWSQNILFLHLPQKINHTGIESFPTFVLFLELVCHFETKPGGSNPYGCRFGCRYVIWKEHRCFALELAEDVVQCAQWKTRSRSWTKTEDRRVLLLYRIPSAVFYKIGTLRRTWMPHWIHPLL